MNQHPLAFYDDAPLPEEPQGFFYPVGDPAPIFAPLASRDELLVAAWRKRVLPPRDYLMGEVFTTTSRTLVVGETGIGKTLFALHLGGAMAASRGFLGWEGRRRSRVMYLDGELPAETFKDRMEMIAARYGDDIGLFGYNRDVLTPDEMPPLNTDAGRAWLWREIETVKPDAIFFDSIMCLLAGNMSEEESWEPVKMLARQITSRRICQIWLHHTGHKTSQSYGTKTREWEQDNVVMLSKVGGEDGAPEMSATFNLEFSKARNKSPANHRQFAPKIVRYTESGFVSEDGLASKAKATSEVEVIRRAFLDAYSILAESVTPSPGFDKKPVRKVKADAIRDEIKNRGYLDTDEKGHLTSTCRSNLRRAKSELLSKKIFAEEAGLVWRIAAM